jgi:hypothetical protein
METLTFDIHWNWGYPIRQNHDFKCMFLFFLLFVVTFQCSVLSVKKPTPCSVFTPIGGDYPCVFVVNSHVISCWAVFKTAVGLWLFRGLSYPLYIGDYNNLRTGNPYKPTSILWNDRGILNTAQLIMTSHDISWHVILLGKLSILLW